MLIFREAHDLSFLRKNQHSLGAGAYGIYYGAFPKHKMQEIKDKLGIIDPNIGIKVYKQNDILNLKQNIREILAIYFIFPELNKIGIRTTHTNQPLSISNLIHNRFIPLRHVDGVELGDIFDSSTTEALADIIESNLFNRMDIIGVDWHDCHSGNYLISEHWGQMVATKWEEYLKANAQATIEEFLNHFRINIVDNITIIDAGGFTCEPGSVAANNILEYQEKIIQFFNYTNSSIANIVYSAFDEMFWEE